MKFKVLQDCAIDGVHCAEGSIIELDPKNDHHAIHMGLSIGRLRKIADSEYVVNKPAIETRDPKPKRAQV